eukprot:scaffold68810_cov54-Phaeocystis_antarctica.AAC.1
MAAAASLSRTTSASSSLGRSLPSCIQRASSSSCPCSTTGLASARPSTWQVSAACRCPRAAARPGRRESSRACATPAWESWRQSARPFRTPPPRAARQSARPPCASLPASPRQRRHSSPRRGPPTG